MSIEMIDANGQYIDGVWRDTNDSETIPVRDPTTEDVITEVPAASESTAQSAIAAANSAQRDWARTPARDRGELVREIAELLSDYKGELADLIVAEQGKPISEALNEVAESAELTGYMAEWDRRIEGDILPGDTEGESVHLQRQPLGVVAGIIPWNYPIIVLVRKLAPALVAGNTVVAKPSEATPISTLYLAELIDEHIDLPDGVFNVVTGAGETGSAMVSSPDVDMVSMTGNVATGKQIMREAAENLTKVSLELGGKAPAIVWKDADIDRAVEDILNARIKNAGQVCQSAERAYVHSDVIHEFEEQYVSAAEAVEFGDPREDPDMGPQVSEQELTNTVQSVERAQQEGGQVLVGGEQPEGGEYETGYWYKPTVVSNVDQEMDIVRDEVFGPVMPIVEIKSLEEAIEYANDSRYGLTSYVHTNDYQTAMRVAEELEFGETYINRTAGESWHGHHIGWNESGLGGEDGKYGFLKYTQLKTVYHNYA